MRRRRHYRRATDAAAVRLGLENHTFEGRAIGEFERAFDRMAAAGMQAVTINGEGVAYQHRSSIGKMTLRQGDRGLASPPFYCDRFGQLLELFCKGSRSMRAAHNDPPGAKV